MDGSACNGNAYDYQDCDLKQEATNCKFIWVIDEIQQDLESKLMNDLFSLLKVIILTGSNVASRLQNERYIPFTKENALIWNLTIWASIWIIAFKSFDD